MINVDIMDTTLQDIITTFVLNKMLHHVDMLGIIEPHEELKYDMDKQNPEWITGDPWYNTSICKKLHRKVFEGFIRNSRTGRYNIMCSIYAHEKEHQSSCDDGSSGRVCLLSSNSTTEALHLLDATIYFIDCLAKILRTQVHRTLLMFSHNMVTLFKKYQLNLLINTNHYYMLLEVVGMWKN